MNKPAVVWMLVMLATVPLQLAGCGLQGGGAGAATEPAAASAISPHQARLAAADAEVRNARAVLEEVERRFNLEAIPWWEERSANAGLRSRRNEESLRRRDDGKNEVLAARMRLERAIADRKALGD